MSQQHQPSSQQTYGGQPGQQTGGQMGQQQQPQTMQQGTSGQSGQQMGGQSGSAHQQTHQRVGQQFEAEMTPELNEALESFDRVVEISEWCADKCIESGPQMAECARLCEDLADLASLNEKLIARDSINGPEVAEAFLRVAQQGMPILQQHQQAPHVQETMQAVTQTIDATNKLLSSIGGGQQGQQIGIREQVQQQGQGQMSQQPQGQMSQQPPSQQSQQPPSQQSQQPQGQSFQQPQGQSFQQPQGQQSQQPQGQSYQQPQGQSHQQPQSQSFQSSY